jgi:predicted molibdopterin-dependent oxidoreductase YjgC
MDERYSEGYADAANTGMDKLYRLEQVAQQQEQSLNGEIAILVERISQLEAENNALKAMRCSTCVYCKNGCSIYAVARENQIAHLRPEDFGCWMHCTPKTYQAAVDAQCGKPDTSPI